MMNDFHGLWVYFYFIFQIKKGLLNQELMAHALMQKCLKYANYV